MNKHFSVSERAVPAFIFHRPVPGAWRVSFGTTVPGPCDRGEPPVTCARRWLHQAAAFGQSSRGQRRRSLDELQHILALNPYLPVQELQTMARELTEHWKAQGRPLRLELLQILQCMQDDKGDNRDQAKSSHREVVEDLIGLMDDHLASLAEMDRFLGLCDRPVEILRRLAGVLDDEEVIFFRLGNLLAAIENKPDLML